MKQFKRVYIEITNVCNLQCSFCPPTKRKKEYMTKENFANILNKIKEHSDYIYFHVKGEPLVHPELEEFLKISYDKGLKVNLTTNGSLIKEKQEILLNSPALRQISFSLQSFEKDTAIMDKEKYIKDIIGFVESAKERDLIFELRLWNLGNDINIEADLVNDFMLNYIEKNLNLPFEIKANVTPGKGIRIDKRIYLSQAKQFAWPDIEKEDISQEGFCYGLRNQIAILVDGTVVPCCLDGEGIINLGNIYKKEFNEIIRCQRATDIVNNFSNRKVIEPLCRKCGFRHKFE